MKAGAIASIGATALFKATKASAIAEPVADSLGFVPISPSKLDAVVVPEGFEVQTLIRWGDAMKGGMPSFNMLTQTAEDQESRFGYNNDFLGYLPLPYGSDNSKHGLLVANHEYVNPEMMFPEGNMLKMALGADKAGLQLRIHAIGDKAIQTILDVYKEVLRQNGPKPRRWTIEHAQHMAPKSFADFASLGVIASMQPYHVIDDGRWALKRIGVERGKGTYAFRTFLDRGVKLAFGSDWTVATVDPLWGIYAAVTRRTLDDKNPGGWYPEQKITLAETIEAYTMGSAYAENAEAKKGSITVGKLADVVILDSDLFAVAPEAIKAVRVTTTIAGGRIVYQKN